MKHLFWTALASTTLLLSACASMSPEECEVANWRQIGLEDGNSGQSSHQLARHQKACTKVGIAPDLAQYRLGYQDGLRHYCQPQNVFSLAMQGRGNVNACPAHQQNLLAPFYQVPRDYVAAKDKVEDLIQQLDRVDTRLHGKITEQEYRQYRQERRNLNLRLHQAQLDYDQAAFRLRQLQRQFDVY